MCVREREREREIERWEREKERERKRERCYAMEVIYVKGNGEDNITLYLVIEEIGSHSKVVMLTSIDEKCRLILKAIRLLLFVIILKDQ